MAKSRITVLLATTVFFLGVADPVVALEYREAMEAARSELVRKAPRAGRIAAAREVLAAVPRAGLADSEWIDLHLLLRAMDEHRRPMPDRDAAPLDPARYAAAIPDDALFTGGLDAVSLLTAAADLRAVRPRPGPAAKDRRAFVRESKRAAAVASRAAALADHPDALMAAAASVLADAARDLAFDLHCYAVGKSHEGTEQFEWILTHRQGLALSAGEVRARGEAAIRQTLVALESQAREIAPDRSWPEALEIVRDDRPADTADLFSYCREVTAEAARLAAESGLLTVPAGARDPEVELLPRYRPDFPTPYARYHPARWGEERYRGKVAITAVPDDLPEAGRAVRLRDRNRHWMRVICAHEGVPGHHLQFAVAGRVTSPYRGFGYNSAYVEGWGLYSEELAERMGIFPDPLTRLSRLRMQLWRAVRVVLDAGLHTGEMTPSEAVLMLTDVVLMERSAAEGEVVRYLGMPTQPLSYLLGARKIAAMRRAYLVRRGPGAEREFHDRFLGFGPIPLEIAAAVLLDRRVAYDLEHP